jgi:aryl-alcohol dehydrogenase-like predicted oxidoreductase
MIYSPLARGKLARAWGETTTRTQAEPEGARQNPATADSDREVVEAVGSIAANRGVSRAQIALAWLRRNPVVAAPIVGTLKPEHIDDAVAALSIILRDDEVARLEAPYTPRKDSQGVSDPAVLHRVMEAATGFNASLLDHQAGSPLESLQVPHG